MTEPKSAPPTVTPPPGAPGRRWTTLLPILAGAALILVALVLIIFVGLRPLLRRDQTHPGIPMTVNKLTPTAPTSPVISQATCRTIIGSGEAEVTAALPLTLTVNNQTFAVIPSVADEAGWTYPAEGAGRATWVCGTVVNYVVGLEATAENEALIAGLEPGNEVRLELSSGLSLIFRFVERRSLPPNDPRIFAQTRPRLTLVLPHAEGEWQIAIADYATETGPEEPSTAPLAQVSQPVVVNDLEVTVTSSHAERGAPGLQPGTMYFLVEYSLTNLGTEPVETATFSTRLRDQLGNVYLPSPAASVFGESGPIAAQVAPGVTAQGSVGYLVPTAMPGPALIWSFSPSPISQAQARVNIPYQAQATPEIVVDADVILTDAFVDGESLIIEGEIQNVGETTVTVTINEISLTSSAGISDLRMAAPPLPWTIEPGQTRVIELHFDRPEASSALLSLLGYSFEITGV